MGQYERTQLKQLIDAYQAEQWSSTAWNISRSAAVVVGGVAAVAVPVIIFNTAWLAARSAAGLLSSGVAEGVDNHVRRMVLWPLKGQSAYYGGKGISVRTPRGTIKRVPYWAQIPLVGWVYAQYLQTRGIEYTGQARSEWVEQITQMEREAGMPPRRTSGNDDEDIEQARDEAETAGGGGRRGDSGAYTA